MKAVRLNGLNIQWPWSQLLLTGEKTVETRSYALPEKYKNVPLAIIETPGPRGRKEAGIEKAKIIGVIIFGDSFRYATKREWINDFNRHRVKADDPQYAWGTSDERWGWVVKEILPTDKTSLAPSPRGIVFASNCKAFVQTLAAPSETLS